MLPFIAATAVIAQRVLGERMFDVQLRGTLALDSRQHCRNANRRRQNAHRCTGHCVAGAQERRRSCDDSERLSGAPRCALDGRDLPPSGSACGLHSAGHEPERTPELRTAADITYATANELGFDFLRDQIALQLSDQVHRSFNAVVIDEADSILIDEARIPLVIAGAGQADSGAGHAVDFIARRMRPGLHYTADPGGQQRHVDRCRHQLRRKPTALRQSF